MTKAICIIFILAFVHQLSRFFDSHYENVLVNVTLAEYPFPSRIEPACQLVMSSWTIQIIDIYFVSYFLFRIIFVHIGPCTMLVIFNVLLYSALKKAEITRKRLFLKHNIIISNSSNHLKCDKSRAYSMTNGGDATMHNTDNMCRQSICIEGRKMNRGFGCGRDANSTTFMLIVVVSVFLIVEIPLAVTTAVHITENLFELELISNRFLNITIIFSNFFIIISYPLNFAIYCGMSRAFRETFQQMFVRHIVNTSPVTSTTTGARTFRPSDVSMDRSNVEAVCRQSEPKNGLQVKLANDHHHHQNHHHTTTTTKPNCGNNLGNQLCPANNQTSLSTETMV